MAINVSVRYNDGFLPDIILLIQCYYQRRTRLNAMKRFCLLQPVIPPKLFDIFPLTGGYSEDLLSLKTLKLYSPYYDFLPCHLFSTWLYFTLLISYFCDSRMGKVQDS